MRRKARTNNGSGFDWQQEVREKIMLSVPDIHCGGKQSSQDSRKWERKAWKWAHI